MTRSGLDQLDTLGHIPFGTQEWDEGAWYVLRALWQELQDAWSEIESLTRTVADRTEHLA